MYLFHRQEASNRIRPENIVITGMRETSEGLVVEFYVKSSSGEVVPADTVTNGIEEVRYQKILFASTFVKDLLIQSSCSLCVCDCVCASVCMSE